MDRRPVASHDAFHVGSGVAEFGIRAMPAAFDSSDIELDDKRVVGTRIEESVLCADQYGDMDHCEKCSFHYDQFEINEVPVELRSLGTAYRSRLEAGVHDPEHAHLLRRRPMPQVWSVLEYSCHFRDVLLAQRERLYLALVEDTPRFCPTYRDERVVLARYSDDSLEEVGHEVDLAANLAARAFARLDDTQWQRRCVYNYPAPAQRTVAWLARHTVHEGRHHLLDIDNVINAGGSGG